TDAEATRQAAEEIARSHAVTTLVHNAGVIRPALLPEVKLDDFQALANLHLSAAIVLAQAMLPAMKAATYGRIVLVSSRAVLGLPTRTSYSATKAGMLGLARTWALELGRQADAAQIVAADHCGAGVLAQRCQLGLVREGVVDPLRDGGRGEKVDQKAVLAVAHHLLHRRRARADHQAAGRHRLEQRPGEDERVSEIDVHRRAAEQRQVIGVRDAAAELDAREIDAIAKLGKQALAINLPRRQSRRVAHFVAADDDDARLRAPPLDFGDGAHEAVEAAIGLEVARY